MWFHLLQGCWGGPEIAVKLAFERILEKEEKADNYKLSMSSKNLI